MDVDGRGRGNVSRVGSKPVCDDTAETVRRGAVWRDEKVNDADMLAEWPGVVA